jgi:hypothetical protein
MVVYDWILEIDWEVDIDSAWIIFAGMIPFRLVYFFEALLHSQFPFHITIVEIIIIKNTVLRVLRICKRKIGL